VPLILSGLQVYTEQGILPNAAVAIHNGLIQKIGESEVVSIKNSMANELLYFPANYHLIAGFIDLHVHGANDRDVMDATPDALHSISAALAAEGTTAFLATTMTAQKENITQALVAVRNFISKQHEFSGAAILGVHLEGPFISSKKAGAQRADSFLTPDITLLEHWQKMSADSIKLVTLAPELPNSAAFIRYLKQKNVIAALGHSDATYAETAAAITEGLSYATHLFNAMRGIHHREPGAVMAALLSDQVSTELIVDGIHLHPAIVQCILKLKRKENLILVTDAMRAKCLGDGIYDLGGQSVVVKKGIATLSDGTLAGSTLKIPTAIQNIIRFTPCSLFDAIKMATENPARVLGIFHKKGSIALGKDADLVVLNDKLEVVLTLCGGKVAYRMHLCP
jgi:N-acetylglucosamine-6-phosphate deacetylase